MSPCEMFRTACVGVTSQLLLAWNAAVKQDEEGSARATMGRWSTFQEERWPARTTDIWALFVLMERD